MRACKQCGLKTAMWDYLPLWPCPRCGMRQRERRVMSAKRTFEDKPAVRERVPLLVGLVGPSSSGKTFSALRLATGMRRVLGGEVFFIDTEARRGTHYADRFQFRHVDFQPPFGPLDYLAAIEHCLKRGASVLVIDSMTHEHSGPGGVMDQSEQFLQKKCGDDWKAREKNLMLSLVRPKAQRKQLNAAIVRLGVNAIFCYRADDKIKPVAGKEPVKLGWQPETTSKLHYDMTQRFLLTPGCDGVPSFFPETDAEKRLVKNPAQFRDLFKPGEQLSEDVGQKLAEWAAGSAAPAQAPASPPKSKYPGEVREALDGYAACATAADFEAMEKIRGDLWKRSAKPIQQALKAASEAAKARLAAAETPADGVERDEFGNPIFAAGAGAAGELFGNDGGGPVH